MGDHRRAFAFPAAITRPHQAQTTVIVATAGGVSP
jgi:hypothetical protein